MLEVSCFRVALMQRVSVYWQTASFSLSAVSRYPTALTGHAVRSLRAVHFSPARTQLPSIFLLTAELRIWRWGWMLPGHWTKCGSFRFLSTRACQTIIIREAVPHNDRSCCRGARMTSAAWYHVLEGGGLRGRTPMGQMKQYPWRLRRKGT